MVLCKDKLETANSSLVNVQMPQAGGYPVMTIRMLSVVVFMLILSTAAAAQCPKDFVLSFSTTNHGFECRDAHGGFIPVDHSHPGNSSKDLTNFCAEVYISMLKLCPKGPRGLECRKAAATERANCLNPGGSGTGTNNGGPDVKQKLVRRKTDASTCEKVYAVRVKACLRRKPAIRSDDAAPIEDPCLADAVAARDACLANSK